MITILNIFDRILTNKGIDTLRGEMVKTPHDTIYTIEDTRGITYLYSTKLNQYEIVNHNGTFIRTQSLDAFILALYAIQ